MMTYRTTEVTALIRGVMASVIAGLISWLTTWQQTDDLKASLITGAITGLSALAFRYGIEGMSDARRQKAGDVRPSDVQPNIQ